MIQRRIVVIVWVLGVNPPATRWALLPVDQATADGASSYDHDALRLRMMRLGASSGSSFGLSCDASLNALKVRATRR